MEKTVKKSKHRIVLAIIVIAILVILAWILLSRPKSQTVEVTSYTPGEISGEYKAAKVDATDDKLVKAAADSKTILWFDQSTGGIVIEDVATGEKVYSVPEGAWDDLKASDDIKKQTGSALLLTYYNINSQKATLFDSYTNAVKLNQISYAPLSEGNGISVRMVLGREDSALLIPEQVSATRFEELLAQIESAIDARSANKVKSLYLKYTFEKATDEQKAKYPVLKDTDIYVLKSSATEKNKKDLEAYFKESGYTYEQLEKDYAELEYESKTESFPCFKVTLDYRLVDGVVKVDLPVGSIEYDRDSFILTSIDLFPFMGAGLTGEEGYMFLPDGSGSIIPFNNDGSASTMLTTGRTYGPDAAESISDRGSLQNEFRYPVFGVKSGEHALFGIVTEGDAISQISCQVGNISHSYNTAYPEFIISQNSTYEVIAFEQAPWIQYDKNGYKGNISIEYHLLTGDQADFAGMASVYGEYIAKNRPNTDVEVKESLPMMVDTIGTVGNLTRVLGVPGYRNVEVTSYKEAADMLQELKDSGVDQVGLRYLSWCNGGYYSYIASDIDMERKVGSKSDLKALQAKAEELGSDLFMDLNLMTADSVKSFSPEFIASSDGIRTLFQKQAFYPVMRPSIQKMVSWYYCTNPKKLLSYYKGVNKDYQKLGIPNISVGTVGEVLNSNYKRSDYTNRQESESIVKELMNQIDSQYEKVMVDSGNAYTFATADYILNLPTSDSKFNVEQTSVPFIQMALHGNIVYAGEPLNYSDDLDAAVLKSIEYGCVPYFKVCDAESDVLKKSEINDEKLYNVSYDQWKERMTEAYEKINSALAGVQDAKMVSHEQLQDNLYVTGYSNGTQIYVNYSDTDVNYSGVKVPAKDCTVIVKKGASGR